MTHDDGETSEKGMDNLDEKIDARLRLRSERRWGNFGRFCYCVLTFGVLLLAFEGANSHLASLGLEVRIEDFVPIWIVLSVFIGLSVANGFLGPSGVWSKLRALWRRWS